MALTLWMDNMLTALFGHKYGINGRDQMGGDTLQRSGATKVTVVEGHRTGFFSSRSFALIFIEAGSVLKEVSKHQVFRMNAGNRLFYF